jgi:hypothetical protein
MAAQRGTVFLSYSVPKLTKDTILQSAKLAKRLTGLSFLQAVGIPKFDKGITLPAQWQLDTKEVNFMATKSKSKKTKGNDSEVLEIKPIDKPVEPINEPEPEIDTPVEDTSKENEKTEEEKLEESTEESEVEQETSVEEEKPEEEVVKEESPTEPEVDISETPEVGADIVDTTEAIASLDEEDEPKAKKFPNKGLVLSLLATLAVGGALTGGILYSKTSLDTRSKAAVPEATSVPAPETTSTPEPTPVAEEIDLTEYSINILNGSGVAGQASAVEGLLEEVGFESMDTGNADSYDYEETEISLAESTPKSVFDAVSEALEDDYEVKKSNAIEEDSDYDILIIVGKN